MKTLSSYLSLKLSIEKDIIEYSFCAMLSSVFCFVNTIIICGLLGDYKYGITFIMLLTPIKMQFVSFHCKTMRSCILSYGVSIGATLLIYNQMIILNHVSFIVPIILFTLLIISVKDDFESKQIKKTIYIFSYILLTMFFNKYNYHLYLLILIVIAYEVIIINLKNVTVK